MACLTAFKMVEELNKANDRVVAFTAERDAAFAQVRRGGGEAAVMVDVSWRWWR